MEGARSCYALGTVCTSITAGTVRRPQRDPASGDLESVERLRVRITSLFAEDQIHDPMGPIECDDHKDDEDAQNFQRP